MCRLQPFPAATLLPGKSQLSWNGVQLSFQSLHHHEKDKKMFISQSEPPPPQRRSGRYKLKRVHSGTSTFIAQNADIVVHLVQVLVVQQVHLHKQHLSVRLAKKNSSLLLPPESFKIQSFSWVAPGSPNTSGRQRPSLTRSKQSM